jgi:hypothetical protein
MICVEAATDCSSRAFDFRSIGREAVEALSRCDSDELERLAERCCGSDADALKHALRAPAHEQVVEFRMLARLLESTQEHIRLIRQLRTTRRVQLEYVSVSGHGGSGAID